MPDYRKAADKAAKKYGVDPAIFRAMLNQESGFNPNARSGAGAQGIAQFMPATARQYGVNLNDGKVSDDLDGAARYIRDNLKRTGGDYKGALSIYNSGRPDAYKDPGFAQGQTYNYVRKIIGAAGTTGKSSAPDSSSGGATTRTVPTSSTQTRQVVSQGTPLADTLRAQLSAAKPSAPTSSGRALPGFAAGAKLAGQQVQSSTSLAPQAKTSLSGAIAQAASLRNPESTMQSTTTGTKTVTTTGGKAKSLGGKSPLLELFWQGKGGINVKNGAKVAQGFVPGHTDHVHVAAGPKTVRKLGELAQSMGLRVGENSAFGDNPEPGVHTGTSLHYRKPKGAANEQAIDVSGDPEAMRKYAREVAKRYGIK
jgi:soluble lytic murein transglycosylase-like protein